jgi:hypothetical protein
MHFRRKTIVGEIITNIGVGIKVVMRRSSLGHEAHPGEVTFLLLVVDLLIFFSKLDESSLEKSKSLKAAHARDMIF